MRTSELDYDLPQSLIATRPAEPRDSARLLIYRRGDDSIEHGAVADLPAILAPGDLMIFNDTAVLPARFLGRRIETGGAIEGLVLEIRAGAANQGDEWIVMLKSGSRLREGVEIELLARETRAPSGAGFRIVGREEGFFRVRLADHVKSEEVLATVGLTPLPQYIQRARGDRAFDDEDDRRWYQTVYADFAQRRSVAAPTAGLHFTPGLLEALDQRGIERERLTLHIGPGTFQPITTETIEEHAMHAESFEVNRRVFERIEAARRAGGRAIAVGTTTVRCLESITPDELSAGTEGGTISGRTTLMIAPPYEFRWLDGLMTNFHLPRSTLLLLVAALVGLDRLKSIYREAIAREYRFYSYGDAMLILP